MQKASELETLQRVCSEVARTKEIGNRDRKKLEKIFGRRFAKALEALKNKQVKKYIFKPSSRIVWIVVGKGQDYLTIPGADFCTCADFYFRVMEKKIHLCYHLIAQKLAEALKVYDLHKEDDKLYNTLMREWKKAID